MTGDESVDDVVDKAVERADTGREVFRAVSVDDRFTKRVRDDHAPNAALHAAIKAAAEDDERIHSVNLMGSHAPGNRHKGEPRYTVRVDVRNEGMGHPVLGATVVGRLVDRGDVRIEDVVECSDDHLAVSIRPIETRVEPINVPVSDIPDEVRGVSETTVAAVLGDLERRLNEELRSVSGLRIFRDTVGDYGDALPEPDVDGSADRLQSLDVRLEDFPDGWRDQMVGPDITNYPPVAPIREWVDDNRDVFDTPGTLTDDGVDAIAEQIAAAIDDAIDTEAPDFTDEPDSMAEATVSGLGLAMVAESVARHGDGSGYPRRDLDIDADAIDKAVDRGVVIERDGVLYDTRDVVKRVQAIEREDDDPFESVTVPCGCGEYEVTFPTGGVPDSFDVVCPECGNHFGQGPAPDEPCPCDHDHEGGSDE